MKAVAFFFGGLALSIFWVYSVLSDAPQHFIKDSVDGVVAIDALRQLVLYGCLFYIAGYLAGRLGVKVED
jgi:hypothetical protein